MTVVKGNALYFWFDYNENWRGFVFTGRKDKALKRIDPFAVSGYL